MWISRTQPDISALAFVYQLNGTVPSEIGVLSALTAFSLHNVPTFSAFVSGSTPGISGTLPTELGALSGLNTLYL